MPDLFLDNSISDVQVVSKKSGVDSGFLDPAAKTKEIIDHVNWVVTHRKAEYLAELFQLRKHKSVSVKRKVAQGLAYLASKNDLETIQTWQLSEGDRETWLILESVIDKIQRGLDGASLGQDVRILSVSEAVGLVKKLLGEKEYTIEGELTEVRPVKQMYYFGLKDTQESRLDCMAFAGVVIRSGFPLNEGLSVRVTGKFKLGKNSRLYFDIQKIDLTGEGELLRNLKLLEEKLSKEGLFDQNRKRKLSKLPKKILLLASSTSAALTDFTKVLGQRRGGVEIYHLPIKTQGIGAEYELIEKLELVNELTKNLEIDTVVLTRGGGSSDDLIVFNSEKVVRALHAINRPTLVAIGHERDVTLAELAADLRASTPSQAAELVSLSRDQVLHQVEIYGLFCQRYFLEKKESYSRVAQQLITLATHTVQRELQFQKLVCERTGKIVASALGQLRIETERIWQRTFLVVKTHINQHLFYLAKLPDMATPVKYAVRESRSGSSSLVESIARKVQIHYSQLKNQFDLVASQIMLHDPQNILNKGYAIVKQHNQIIEKKADVLDNQSLVIIMQDGEITR